MKYKIAIILVICLFFGAEEAFSKIIEASSCSRVDVLPLQIMVIW
jgi:hypothetical protein